jgi:hypothetical protein
MTTLQQIIDIPHNRRLHLEFEAPEAVPEGQASLALCFQRMAKPGARKLGTLKGKGAVAFAPDYKMTEEEFLGL